MDTFRRGTRIFIPSWNHASGNSIIIIPCFHFCSIHHSFPSHLHHQRVSTITLLFKIKKMIILNMIWMIKRSYFPEPNRWPSFVHFWDSFFTSSSYWKRYSDFPWWFWILQVYWTLIFVVSLHLTFICISFNILFLISFFLV